MADFPFPSIFSAGCLLPGPALSALPLQQENCQGTTSSCPSRFQLQIQEDKHNQRRAE